jgi:hypothetical protein
VIGWITQKLFLKIRLELLLPVSPHPSIRFVQRTEASGSPSITAFPASYPEWNVRQARAGTGPPQYHYLTTVPRRVWPKKENLICG